jgi:hypothetical protein
MQDGEWKEIRKEFDIDAIGNEIPKRVTYENTAPVPLNKKDKLDFLLKSVGLLAIFTPLILVYFQQANEIKKQKNLLQVDLYSDASSQLHILFGKGPDTLQDPKSYTSLIYGTYPKLFLVSNTSVKSSLSNLKCQMLKFTSLYRFFEFNSRADKLYSLFVNGFYIPYNEDDPRVKPQSDTDFVYERVISLRQELEKIRFLDSVQHYQDSINHLVNAFDNSMEETLRKVNQVNLEMLNFIDNITQEFRFGQIDFGKLAAKFMEFKEPFYRKLGYMSKLKEYRLVYFSSITNTLNKVDSTFTESNSIFINSE